MEDFCSAALAGYDRIVINGYFPSVTVKNVLGAIIEDTLGEKRSFRTPLEQCRFIREQFEADSKLLRWCVS